MTLDFNQFPAMKNLAEDVRKKAVEFAETLGARGPRPTTVLGTAVTLAQEWKSGRLRQPVAAPFLVQPRAGRWVIKRSSSETASHVFMRKDDAVRRAQELAKAEGAACFVFGPGGTLIERYEARSLAAMAFPELAAGEAAPVEAAPVEAAVVEAAPVEVAPVEVAPVEVAAVEVAPVEVAAVEVAAVEVAPVEVAPVAEDEEPILVKRLANKWLIVLGDGRTETLPSKAKAVKRAQELARKLGRSIAV